MDEFENVWATISVFATVAMILSMIVAGNRESPYFWLFTVIFAAVPLALGVTGIVFYRLIRPFGDKP
jgi:hypothetical protein